MQEDKISEIQQFLFKSSAGNKLWRLISKTPEEKIQKHLGTYLAYLINNQIQPDPNFVNKIEQFTEYDWEILEIIINYKK